MSHLYSLCSLTTSSRLQFTHSCPSNSRGIKAEEFVSAFKVFIFFIFRHTEWMGWTVNAVGSHTSGYFCCLCTEHCILTSSIPDTNLFSPLHCRTTFYSGKIFFVLSMRVFILPNCIKYSRFSLELKWYTLEKRDILKRVIMAHMNQNHFFVGNWVKLSST